MLVAMSSRLMYGGAFVTAGRLFRGRPVAGNGDYSGPVASAVWSITSSCVVDIMLALPSPAAGAGAGGDLRPSIGNAALALTFCGAAALCPLTRAAVLVEVNHDA